MKKLLFLLVFCTLISCKQEKKYDADEVQKMVDQKVEEKLAENNQTETKNNTKDKASKTNVSLADIEARKGYYSDYQKKLEAKMDPLDETFIDSDDYVEENFDIALDLGEKWDIELNKIYKIVMDKLTSEQQNELRAEEKKWLKKLEEKTSRPSSARMENATDTYKMTRERTYYLVKLNSKIDQQ